jgi:hypothetical protein
MSKLRPTLVPGDGSGLGYDATFRRVWEAVKGRRSLAHGTLHDRQLGVSCAVGSAFDENCGPLNSKAIDEIAAYNDSFPGLTPHQRWTKVRAWLKWRAETRGMRATQ